MPNLTGGAGGRKTPPPLNIPSPLQVLEGKTQPKPKPKPQSIVVTPPRVQRQQHAQAIAAATPPPRGGGSQPLGFKAGPLAPFKPGNKLPPPPKVQKPPKAPKTVLTAAQVIQLDRESRAAGIKTPPPRVEPADWNQLSTRDRLLFNEIRRSESHIEPLHVSPSTGRGLGHAEDYLQGALARTMVGTNALVRNFEHPGRGLGEGFTAASHVKARNGKIELTGTPQEQGFAGQFLTPTFGNPLVTTGEELLGIVPGALDLGLSLSRNPKQGAEQFGGQLRQSVEETVKHPLWQLTHDPLQFALNVSVPFSVAGSVAGRLADAAEVARTIDAVRAGRTEGIPYEALYRSLPKGHATYMLANEESLPISRAQEVGKVAGALVKTPRPRQRSIQVSFGDHPAYVHPVGSKNYTVNLAQRGFDKGVSAALEHGHGGPLGLFERYAYGRAGREIRAEQRVASNIRQAPITSLRRYGQTSPARLVARFMDRPSLLPRISGHRLNSAQEMAALARSLGWEPDRLAQAFENNAKAADQIAEKVGGNTEEIKRRNLELAILARKSQEHFNDPLVREASDAIRHAIEKRQQTLGMSENDALRSIGSHYAAVEHSLDELRGVSPHEELAALDARAEELNKQLERAPASEHDKLHAELQAVTERKQEIENHFVERGKVATGKVSNSEERQAVQALAQRELKGEHVDDFVKLMDAAALKWAREKPYRRPEDFFSSLVHDGQVTDAGQMAVSDFASSNESGKGVVERAKEASPTQKADQAVAQAETPSGWFENYEPVLNQLIGKEATAILHSAVAERHLVNLMRVVKKRLSGQEVEAEDWKSAIEAVAKAAQAGEIDAEQEKEITAAIAALRHDNIVSAELNGLDNNFKSEGEKLPTISTADVPYARGEQITRSVAEPLVRQLAHETGVTVTKIEYGPGGYEGTVSPSFHVHVIGPDKNLAAFRDALGASLDQWAVWLTRPGAESGNLALTITAPAFSDPAKVEAFWHALRQEKPELLGFAPFTHRGEHGIRIVTDRTAGDPQAFSGEFKTAIENAATNSGVGDVRYGSTHVEVREGAADQAGQGYVHRLHTSGFGSVAERVANHHRPEAIRAFREALARHSGVPGRPDELIRRAISPAQLRELEHSLGVKDGNWTPEQGHHLVTELTNAADGKPVDPVVQSVFNESFVAPPEAFYLPFEKPTKPINLGSQRNVRMGPSGLSPAQRIAMKRHRGVLFQQGDFRTDAVGLAERAATKADHFARVSQLHEILWNLSKEFPEETGHPHPTPIRDIKTIPESLKREMYSIYSGEHVSGEAIDELAKRIFVELMAPADLNDPHVRWLNPALVAPLTPETMGVPLRMIDRINSLFRVGRFLTPAYGLKWLPQNFSLNVLQQGPFVLRSAMKYTTELEKLDPEVYYEIANAMDTGPTAAFMSERPGDFQRSLALMWQKINDHIPRMLSFIHEATREGFRTAEDWTTLMRDPRLHDVRNSIIRRANKEAIDYGAMTQKERAWVKPLFAYWPWTRSAGLYTLRFPFEHPYQAWLYMQLGERGKSLLEQFYLKHYGAVPSFMRSYFPAKSGPIMTDPLNISTTLGEDLAALGGMTSVEHPEYRGDFVGQLGPLDLAAAEAITGNDKYGEPIKGTSPLLGAAKDLTDTFLPYRIYTEAKQKQTGMMPKGGMAALERYLGDYQLSGFDYQKAADSGLKAESAINRDHALAQIGNMAIDQEVAKGTITPAEAEARKMKLARSFQLVYRIDQIDESGLSSDDKIRATIIASAGFEGWTLDHLNTTLAHAQMRPASEHELEAERRHFHG